jgi:3',5'-cyclic AMP phosphodiesterase CpdA
MRLNILSDLHLSLAGLAPPDNDADLVVLAGDIARPREAMAWAASLGKPVLYVPGNHEFYGSSLDTTLAELHRWSAGTAVQVLDDRQTVIGGVRFLGSTLWTDFQLFGTEGAERDTAIAAAQRLMRDFGRIRTAESGAALFTPAQSQALHARHARWLQDRLAVPHDGPTVVITHHAPSARSIHPRFAGSPLNACFVSNADHLLGAQRVGLWIHGHTHDSFDYLQHGTRVVCNPRGYAKDGVNENLRFDPDFIVEV